MVVVITNLDMSLSLRSFVLLESSHIRRYFLNIFRIKYATKVRHIPNRLEYLDIRQIGVYPVRIQSLASSNQTGAALTTMDLAFRCILVASATGHILTENLPSFYGRLGLNYACLDFW